MSRHPELTPCGHDILNFSVKAHYPILIIGMGDFSKPKETDQWVASLEPPALTYRSLTESLSSQRSWEDLLESSVLFPTVALSLPHPFQAFQTQPDATPRELLLEEIEQKQLALEQLITAFRQDPRGLLDITMGSAWGDFLKWADIIHTDPSDSLCQVSLPGERQGQILRVGMLNTDPYLSFAQ